jgi:hypothetical protein
LPDSKPEGAFVDATAFHTNGAAPTWPDRIWCPALSQKPTDPFALPSVKGTESARAEGAKLASKAIADTAVTVADRLRVHIMCAHLLVED